jgi:hypothetical protein
MKIDSVLKPKHTVRVCVEHLAARTISHLREDLCRTHSRLFPVTGYQRLKHAWNRLLN